jgi:hypothetical protein
MLPIHQWTAPIMGFGDGHWTEFLQGVQPKSVEQLGSSYMASGIFASLLSPFQRCFECITQENVGIPRISRIVEQNPLKCLLESNCLHITVEVRDQLAREPEHVHCASA